MDEQLKAALQRPRLSLNLTVSGPMMVALWHLAEKSGLGPTTVAKQLLRQSLDRTISSAAVADDIAEYKAYRTNRQWREDQADLAEAFRSPRIGE